MTRLMNVFVVGVSGLAMLTAGEAAAAKRLLAVLPDGPVRTALEAFADVVADRTR